jgi:hypothetical protein
MERLLKRLSGSPLGWIGASLSLVWKGTEIAHNAEYLNSIVVEHFDAQAVARFVFGHPSLVFLGLATAWIFHSRRRPVVPNAVPALVPAVTAPKHSNVSSPNIVPLPSGIEGVVEFDELIVKERITEREVVYRKASRK